jgi:hypothetical protein
MPAVATVVDKGYKVLECGLSISRALSSEEWRRLGQHLAQVHARTLWALGDWLNAGKQEDGAPDYAYAAEVTGRSFESLSQLARVARAFPLERRTHGMPWSFYREALRLPDGERAHALNVAQYNAWSRDELADYIKSQGCDALERTHTVTRIDATSAQRAASGVTRAGWKRAKSHHKQQHCPRCGYTWSR